MKKTTAVTGLIALVLGFLLGSALPAEQSPPADAGQVPAKSAVSVSEPAPAISQQSTVLQQPAAKSALSVQEEQFNPKENFPLLNAACAVLRSVQERDYKTLASYVDPEQGLTFTTFSTVNREVDPTFSALQVAGFEKDAAEYNWGVIPGSGELLTLTPKTYFAQYLAKVDYTQATQIGLDKICVSGNALENVTQAYPGCRFVEFAFPAVAAESQGQDWCALKLVFVPNQDQWRLVGMIHSQWTV